MHLQWYKDATACAARRRVKVHLDPDQMPAIVQVVATVPQGLHSVGHTRAGRLLISTQFYE